ncbi:MAG: hypothetical protein Unbinned1469contig1000_32 [Prokaryotic dsDNA virus sp.]|jgi:hypothetical protein|nr:MAG: hypothetical protein Unbinned1469contig1000_32 [Prokaryotic dsDNA virus sp.]|tara:strand:- start:387 stop:749 length:363 start_codon:yes stop_codon:yes gene_type:complete
MAIEKNEAGDIHFTGNDIRRYQVVVLEHEFKYKKITKNVYFRMMFKLYHTNKLILQEIATLFANAQKYQKTADKIMTQEDIQVRADMVQNGFMDSEGNILVDLDALAEQVAKAELEKGGE